MNTQTSRTIMTGVTAEGTRMMFNYNTGTWQAFNVNKVTKGHHCDNSVMARVMAQVNAEVMGLKFSATQTVTIN